MFDILFLQNLCAFLFSLCMCFIYTKIQYVFSTLKTISSQRLSAKKQMGLKLFSVSLSGMNCCEPLRHKQTSLLGYEIAQPRSMYRNIHKSSVCSFAIIVYFFFPPKSAAAGNAAAAAAAAAAAYPSQMAAMYAAAAAASGGCGGGNTSPSLQAQQAAACLAAAATNGGGQTQQQQLLCQQQQLHSPTNVAAALAGLPNREGITIFVPPCS